MMARPGMRLRSRLGLLLLLGSLLLGAWLAALHPIVHLRVDAGHTHEAGGLKKLLGSHGSAADCLVFDHLHHGDGLPAQVLALPAAAPQPAPSRLRLRHALLPPVLPFQARAPPATSVFA